MDNYDPATVDRAGDCEARLIRMWEKNLGASVGSGDDYFLMGGDSLRAAQLLVWIQEGFGIELSLLDLFECRTPAAQMELIQARLSASPQPAGKPATEYRFFGPASARLFGALHRPGVNAATSGVVLCYPMGQEYMRIHRTYVELARSLAAAGHHVLRFDYIGCGDSAGDSIAGDLDRWRDDIRRAIREMRTATGVRDVYLMGARIGGNLVLDVAQDDSELAGIVLWEPIVNGADYIAALRKAHHDLLASNAELDGYEDRALPPHSYAEFVGYPISRKLHDEVKAIDLAALRSFPPQLPALVLANTEKPQLKEFVNARNHGRTKIEYANAGESDAIWLKEDRQNKGLIPVQAIQTIVLWISSRISRRAA